VPVVHVFLKPEMKTWIAGTGATWLWMLTSIQRKIVTTGLDPVVHVFLKAKKKAWIAGTAAGDDGLSLNLSTATFF
jgi:hypothetical protein